MSTNTGLVRAKVVEVDLRTEQDSHELAYSIDSRYEGVIRLVYPAILDRILLNNGAGLYGILLSMFLAQLCLAEKIVVNFPCPEKAWHDLKEILNGLYAVRAYREKVPLLEAPEITCMNKLSFWQFPDSPSRTDKRACLFLSGGIDSTLSILELQSRGYDVLGVHLNVNVDAESAELTAVDTVSHSLGIKVLKATFIFPQFLEISSAYSSVFRSYPYENSVPHGRELVLLPIGLVAALSTDCQYICFGHEREAWTKQVHYQGASIYRCDTQSLFATRIFNSLAKQWFSPHLSVFSPVSAYTDFGKFSYMAERWPHIMAQTSSCFWGSYCGECAKCVPYFLYQLALENQVFSFESDPLAELSPILAKYLHQPQSQDLFTLDDIHYALGSIILRGLYGKTSPFLDSYTTNVLPLYIDNLDHMRKKLTRRYPDDLFPLDFQGCE